MVTRTSRRRFTFEAFLRHRSWLREADERYVVAGHAYLSGLGVAVAMASGARSACIAYGRELTPRRPLLRLSLAPLAMVTRVLAISTHTARLVRRAGARPSSIRIVQPALRSPWLAVDACGRDAGRGLRLATLTRLSDGYKNIELLLRLTAVLHPIGVIEQLTVIGSGPRRELLRTKAAELGVAQAVAFPGRVPDLEVIDVLSNSHVGVFASRDSLAERGFEGFGLVIHELAAGGLPVLVGSAAGAVDSAAHSWATLLDPDDLWAWVEAVETLYGDEAGRRGLRSRRSELGTVDRR